MLPTEHLELGWVYDFDCIANRWEYYQEDKAEFKDKPDEIKQYEIYLKKALFAYNKKTKAYADGSFETALEYLQEIIVNNSLRVWFDRPIDFSISEGFSLDPIAYQELLLRVV